VDPSFRLKRLRAKIGVAGRKSDPIQNSAMAELDKRERNRAGGRKDSSKEVDEVEGAPAVPRLFKKKTTHPDTACTGRTTCPPYRNLRYN